MVPALAVSVTDPPEQKVNGPPAVMVGAAGTAFTVTVAPPLYVILPPLVAVVEPIALTVVVAAKVATA